MINARKDNMDILPASSRYSCWTYGTFFVLTIVFFEKFAFYGLSSLLQIYLEGNKGAHTSTRYFELSQTIATAIFNGFMVLCSLTPIGAAAASDIFLGRYKTLLIALFIYTLGALAMVLSALPHAIDYSFRMGSLVIALVLLSVGVGGVKATLTAFLGDQLTRHDTPGSDTKSEELDNNDRLLASRKLFNIYFWVINLGSTSIVVVPWVLVKFDFWAAYTLCFASIVSAAILAVTTKKLFVIHEPKVAAIPKSYRLLSQYVVNGFNLKRARATNNWNDKTFYELKRCILAGSLLLYAFPPMWLCMSQLFSNLISQAAQMKTHGLPNEIVPFFNAAACMILVPVVQYTLGNLPPKYRPGPIIRISIGFVLSGVGFAYTAGLQSLIFHTGPCYDMPRECPASADGTIPNNISFFLQVPVHVAVALGEILSIVTGLEYAYEMAPADMKAMVQAAYSLGSGLGSLAGLAFSPLAQNPQLVLLYSLLAAIMMCSAMGVWCCLRKYNSDSEVA